MNDASQRSDESKTCRDRVKEIATGSTRILLIGCAALLLIWATKLEPSFDPVLRYEDAVKRQKTAAKVYRKELNLLNKRFGNGSTWRLNPKARPNSKPNEPEIEWVIQKQAPPPEPPSKENNETVETPPELPPGFESDEEPTPEALEPTSRDKDRLDKVNKALFTIRASSLDTEVRKLNATSVEFEFLSYKFPASVLYAPIIWNLCFLGLLIYTFFSRLRLFKFVIRSVELGATERLYHVPWWATPLPHIQSRNYLFERVGRTLGWDEGSKGPVIPIAVTLVLATLLQGRVAQLGLAITETLGSGREASLLKICYYVVFGVFFAIVLIWLGGTIFRAEKTE